MSTPRFETPRDLLRRIEPRGESLLLEAHLAHQAGEDAAIRMPLAPSKLVNKETPDTVAQIFDWYRAWRDAAATRAFTLESTRRNFWIAKQIDIPKAVIFASPEAFAHFLGGGALTRLAFLISVERWVEVHLGRKLQSLPALREVFRASPEDQASLKCLLEWRARQSPGDLKDVALREVPVAGLHTKWIEEKRGLVLAVFQDLGWLAAQEGTLSQRLGLAERDRGELWIRLHSEQARASGLPARMGSTPSEMPQPPGIDRVLIIENKTAFDRLDVPPGTGLVYGSGKAFLSYAPRIAWLKRMSRIHYWGDCDGAGYFILSRLRETLPQTVSLLMDEATVERWADRIGQETEREAVQGHLPNLTPEEARARERLHARGQRLEQERISLTPEILAKLEVETEVRSHVTARDATQPKLAARPEN